jgi:hypothetical protein
MSVTFLDHDRQEESQLGCQLMTLQLIHVTVSQDDNIASIDLQCCLDAFGERFDVWLLKPASVNCAVHVMYRIMQTSLSNVRQITILELPVVMNCTNLGVSCDDTFILLAACQQHCF